MHCCKTGSLKVTTLLASWLTDWQHIARMQRNPEPFLKMSQEGCSSEHSVTASKPKTSVTTHWILTLDMQQCTVPRRLLTQRTSGVHLWQSQLWFNRWVHAIGNLLSNASELLTTFKTCLSQCRNIDVLASCHAGHRLCADGRSEAS